MYFFLFYTNESNKSNTAANCLRLHLLYREDYSVSVNKALLVLHKCNFSLFTDFFVHHASCSPFLPFWIQLPFFLNNNPEFFQQNLKTWFSASLLNANLSLYGIQGYHPFFSSLITYFVSFWSILLPLRKPATSAIIPLQIMSFQLLLDFSHLLQLYYMSRSILVFIHHFKYVMSFHLKIYISFINSEKKKNLQTSSLPYSLCWIFSSCSPCFLAFSYSHPLLCYNWVLSWFIF